MARGRRSLAPPREAHGRSADRPSKERTMPLLLQVAGYPGYAPPPEVTLFGLNATILWWAVGGAILIAAGMLGFVQFLRAFLFIARPSETLVFSGGSHRMEDGTSIGYAIV